MNTTKTAQFTPGPWIVETTNTLPGECADNVHRLCYPGYRIHGICAIWNNTRTSKANATLIAAAPAMYAIIKDMREAFYVKGTRRALLEVMERSKDVLAQAEGQHHE